jgi:ABC-type phosphate transport system auxiliary subunit
MNNEQMQAAIKELQDAVIVMAHIEKRQSEQLNDVLEFRTRTERNLAEITDKLNGLIGSEQLNDLLEFRTRTERNLAEITDKLNGLIGYVDGQRPH